jgi:hypothetical protein
MVGVAFLGAFAESQKAIISFVKSPSVRIELGSNRTDLNVVRYLRILVKFVDKIQV